MFYYTEQNGVPALKCRALEPYCNHAFATRKGGISQTEGAESMNFSASKEPVQVVKENYKIFAAAFGFDYERITLTRQIHSDLVVPVDRDYVGTGLFIPYKTEGCDGLTSALCGVPLGVFSADCSPILMADTKTGAVAAVHAGWRGCAAGIGKKAVVQMGALYGSDPSDIIAAIGPCIEKNCYEVGLDMKVASGLPDRFFTPGENGKFLFDLKGANAALLREAGVGQVFICDECTHCNAEYFYSHRRQGPMRGTMVSLIAAKED